MDPFPLENILVAPLVETFNYKERNVSCECLYFWVFIIILWFRYTRHCSWVGRYFTSFKTHISMYVCMCMQYAYCILDSDRRNDDFLNFTVMCVCFFLLITLTIVEIILRLSNSVIFLEGKWISLIYLRSENLKS